MIILNKPELKPNPVTDNSFSISLLGKSERLPYRSYVDDFDSPVDHNILIVIRDIPEYGWMVAQSLESYYRDFLRLHCPDSGDES
jgi:hypothetical protein